MMAASEIFSLEMSKTEALTQVGRGTRNQDLLMTIHILNTL
jgi:DNA helicase TIP49 (TBP-interacting protein)